MRSRARSLLLLVAGTSVATLAIAASATAAVVPVPAPATLVSANPADQTPHARDGETRAFAEIGNTVYVGGTFTQIKTATGTTWGSRSYLFAYDRVTGALSTTFLPVLDGAVNSLVAGPTGDLIVGGAFRNVNGVARRNLVALDPVTGQTEATWVGRSDGGTVRTMKLLGDDLYVGGAFSWVNGAAHSGLARLDASTGAIDPTFQVDTTVGRHSTSFYVWTLDVTPDGNTLVVGGNFTLVNGLARNQIALVDVSGVPSVIDWSTDKFAAPCASPNTFVHYVQEVQFSADGSYFIVGTNGGGGWPAAYCDALVRFETADRGSGKVATWVDFTGNDTITSIEIAGGVVYLGGHFRWLNNPNASDTDGPGAIDRLGIAAVDPANGMPVNWNPRRSAGSALPPGALSWGSSVPVLWRGSHGLYFGQNSDGMGNEYHGRLGMFPLSGGRSFTPKNPPSHTSGYLYLATAAGQLTKVAYNGVSLGAETVTSQPNVAGAGAVWRVSDRVYLARTVAGAPTGSRLDVAMFNGATVGVPWEASGYNDWYERGCDDQRVLSRRPALLHPGEQRFAVVPVLRDRRQLPRRDRVHPAHHGRDLVDRPGYGVGRGQGRLWLHRWQPAYGPVRPDRGGGGRRHERLRGGASERHADLVVADALLRRRMTSSTGTANTR